MASFADTYDRKATPESPYAMSWNRDGTTAQLWDCFRQQWLSASYQSDVPSDVWPTLKDSERAALELLPEQREDGLTLQARGLVFAASSRARGDGEF